MSTTSAPRDVLPPRRKGKAHGVSHGRARGVFREQKRIPGGDYHMRRTDGKGEPLFLARQIGSEHSHNKLYVSVITI